MPFFVDVKCCQCGEVFGLSSETHAVLKRSSQGFNCPFGHPLHFPQGETEADKIRRERDRLKQQQAYLHEELKSARSSAEHERRRANGYKGHAARITKRVKAGVCICCNRSFKDLARHMASKHPTLTPLAIEQGAPEGATVQ